MNWTGLKKLKGFGFFFGFVSLSLIIIYLSFPAWIGVVISSQLPEDVSLQFVETSLPNWDRTFVKNIKVKVNDLLITLEDLELDYQLTDIKIARVLVEELPESSSINKVKDDLENSMNFKLPVISHSDFEQLEFFKKVSIKKLELKTQTQTINILKLGFNRAEKGIYQLSTDKVNINDDSSSTIISKLKSNLDINSEQIKLQLFQSIKDSEQSLLSVIYQLTDQHLRVVASVNYNNIKTLLPPELKDAAMVPQDVMTIEWLQNRADNKLQISVSSLVKSSKQSFVENEFFPAKLTVSTESKNFPLLAKVSFALNSENLIKLDSKQFLADFSPFTFKSYFNITLADLSVDDAKLLLADINYELRFGTLNFKNKDTPINLNSNQATLIGQVSDIDTSLANIENSHWNLTAQFLLPSFSIDYMSSTKDQSKDDSNLSDSVEIKADVKIDFQLEKKLAVKIHGELEANKMEINHANGQLKSSMKVKWINIDPNLSEGTAEIIVESSEGNIASLNYKKAKLLGEVIFTDKEIKGKGNLSVNQQLLAPYSFDYNKEISDLSITLQKNQLANQLLNYFLKPFSKDVKIPLAITHGEVVHSASLELSDEMIVESIFNINDLSFNFGENNIYGLNLTQKLTSFSPIRLQSNLSIESINFSSGLEITNINTKIDNTINEVFETKIFTGELFKGKLFSKAIKFSSEGIEQSIIELKKISLTELIFFLEVPGLYADGNIDFSLPFSLKEGVIIIKEGNFKAQDKGIIKYTYTDTESGEEENIALKALKNFHYESLDGTFSYNKDGLYHIKLHLLGSNPDLYDGYPVDFILNLRGELSGLFRSLFLTGNFEEAIMEQIKASDVEQ